MAIFKKIFLVLFLALVFFSVSGQNVSAGFSYGGSGPCNDMISKKYANSFTVNDPNEYKEVYLTILADGKNNEIHAYVEILLDPTNIDTFTIKNDNSIDCAFFNSFTDGDPLFTRPMTDSSDLGCNKTYAGHIYDYCYFKKIDLSDLSKFPSMTIGTEHHIACEIIRAGNAGNGGALGGCIVSMPPSCSFSASPTTIAIGESATLTWSTEEVISAVINPGGTNITDPDEIKEGSIIVNPTATTEYTMTAVPFSGFVTCPTATVTVTPPTCTLTADPDSVFSGSATQLKWQISGAAAAANVTIDKGVGSSLASPSGTANTKAITAPTTFTLTFNGLDDQPHSCSAKVGITIPPKEGLVPCGRLGDNPDTKEIDESKPCDFCAAFYMLKKTLNFAMELAFTLAILTLVISGLLYAFSAGDTSLIEKAKNAIYYALLGLAIMFVAWVIIASILKGLGFAGIAKWNQVDCQLQTASVSTQAPAPNIPDCGAIGSVCASDTQCCSGVCGTNVDSDNYFSSILAHTGTCQTSALPYTDCDDNDKERHPGHPGYNYTDEKDNDCDGVVDNCTSSSCSDNTGKKFGPLTNSPGLCGVFAPTCNTLECMSSDNSCYNLSLGTFIHLSSPANCYRVNEYLDCCAAYTCSWWK